MPVADLEQRADDELADGALDSTFTQIEWDATYLESAGNFAKVIRRVADIADGDLTCVRRVFWCDS